MLIMRRFTLPCRWAATALLLSSLFVLLGAPVCQSERCPMAAGQRAACRAMGLDCCRDKGGAVSHGSHLAPALAPAVLPGGTQALTGPDSDVAGSRSSPPNAAPAVVQGVGLFTLFAVFRI